jgi:hypothetical protein
MGSTMAPGTYHIKKMSASGIEMARIASFTSAEFGGVQGTANSDPMKRPKLPMSNIELVQDQYLQVDFVPSNTTTEHSTSAAYVATVKIPFRALDLATGVVARNDFVTNGGMTAGYPNEYTFTAIRTYLNSQVWKQIDEFTSTLHTIEGGDYLPCWTNCGDYIPDIQIQDTCGR